MGGRFTLATAVAERVLVVEDSPFSPSCESCADIQRPSSPTPACSLSHSDVQENFCSLQRLALPNASKRQVPRRHATHDILPHIPSTFSLSIYS